MAPPRDPRGRRARAARGLAARSARWGASGDGRRRPLRDGDELGFADRTWRVHHRPGHSPSDTVFHDEAQRRADRRRPPDQAHLVQPADLAAAGAAATPASARRRCVIYLDSLRATREMDLRVVLPGHGEPSPTTAR